MAAVMDVTTWRGNRALRHLQSCASGSKAYTANKVYVSSMARGISGMDTRSRGIRTLTGSAADFIFFWASLKTAFLIGPANRFKQLRCANWRGEFSLGVMYGVWFRRATSRCPITSRHGQACISQDRIHPTYIFSMLCGHLDHHCTISIWQWVAVLAVIETNSSRRRALELRKAPWARSRR